MRPVKTIWVSHDEDAVIGERPPGRGQAADSGALTGAAGSGQNEANPVADGQTAVEQKPALRE